MQSNLSKRQTQTFNGSRSVSSSMLSFERYCLIITILKSRRLSDLPECISKHPTFDTHLERVTTIARQVTRGNSIQNLTQLNNYKNKFRISIELESYQNVRKFRLTGSDLDPFLSYIPRDIRSGIPEYGKLLCKKPGNSFYLHYRKYPYSWFDTMTTIATALRVLESMSDEEITYHNPYIKGRVGIEIPYNLPSGFTLPQRRKELDPVQHNNGIYYYCSGGISLNRITTVLKTLSTFIPMTTINDNIVTNTETMHSFLQCNSIFSLSSSSKHTQFLIKVPSCDSTTDIKLLVVDPWKRNPKSISHLQGMSPTTKIELLIRQKSDQHKEGSCVNASLARMLQTAYDYTTTDPYPLSYRRFSPTRICFIVKCTPKFYCNLKKIIYHNVVYNIFKHNSSYND